MIDRQKQLAILVKDYWGLSNGYFGYPEEGTPEYLDMFESVQSKLDTFDKQAVEQALDLMLKELYPFG